MWLATLLERVNIRLFEVNFKNIFILYLWVFLCVQVGDNSTHVAVKCQSTCFYSNNSGKSPVVQN